MNVMKTFTLIHVAISLVAIYAGFVVVFSFLKGKQLGRWTGLFLATTALTTITGFFFPFHGITPAIVVGIVSLIPLALAIYSWYARQLLGGWRRIYVCGALLSLYLNVFVFIVQSFDKIPALKALAPTQNAPLFQGVPATVLILFIALGAVSFRNVQNTPAPKALANLI